MSSRRVRFAVVGAVLGAALVAGCGSTTGGSHPVTDPPTTSQATEPAEITIPAIGAHSTLVGLGLNDDGAVEVPPVSAPLQAGRVADPKGDRRPRPFGSVVRLHPVEGAGDRLLPLLVELLPGGVVHRRVPLLVLGPVVADVVLALPEADRQAGRVGRAEGGG